MREKATDQARASIESVESFEVALTVAYRVFQLGLPALLGLLALRQIRRRLADEKQTAAVAGTLRGPATASVTRPVGRR